MDKCRGAGGASGGAIWFIGWMFTAAFANLPFWHVVWGIVIWPWYLGRALMS